MHTGDLPSVLVNEDGTATIEFTDSRLDVADLVDKAVVLHAGPDNFGNVPMTDYTANTANTANTAQAIKKTQDTGNAGDRIACGVITVR